MSAYTSEPTFIEYTAAPQTDHTRPLRDCVRLELRGALDSAVELISHGQQRRMHYTSKEYASKIVVKCRHMLKGWPSHIPFRNLSSIGGGTRSLLELQWRWNLPKGHKDRLRFEPATDEQVENAIRDPDSVHPNRDKLTKEKAAAVGKPARQPTVTIVVAQVYHPDDLAFVGLNPTSTRPRVAGITGGRRSQRADMGRRRKRASDISGETRVRALHPMPGITSPAFVLPAKRSAGEMGCSCMGDTRNSEQAGKRARVAGRELAVNDQIDQFVLSSAFGGTMLGGENIGSDLCSY